jgi:hypothetical protein
MWSDYCSPKELRSVHVSCSCEKEYQTSCIVYRMEEAIYERGPGLDSGVGFIIRAAGTMFVLQLVSKWPCPFIGDLEYQVNSTRMGKNLSPRFCPQ